jgi:DNA-binding transcriptional ArsR family regulator
MTKSDMDEFLSITAALADENRVRALLALRGGELCLCQVVELLRLAPSTVSKHLSILKQAGLVHARKEGRWMYYRLPDEQRDDVPPPVRQALEFVTSCVGKTDTARQDVRAVCCIVKEDPEDLCKRQRSKCCSSAPETPAAARWRKAGLAT